MVIYSDFNQLIAFSQLYVTCCCVGIFSNYLVTYHRIIVNDSASQVRFCRKIEFQWPLKWLEWIWKKEAKIIWTWIFCCALFSYDMNWAYFTDVFFCTTLTVWTLSNTFAKHMYIKYFFLGYYYIIYKLLVGVENIAWTHLVLNGPISPPF